MSLYSNYSISSLRELISQCENQYEIYSRDSEEQRRKGNAKKSEDSMHYALRQSDEISKIRSELARRGAS